MFNTISARQIQRGYKKVLEDANKTKEPIVVMSNNKPQGAVIGLDLLEQMRLNQAAKEALAEYKKGQLKSITSEKELEDHFKEIDKMV
jgi:prevent-host-death family protein